MNLRQQLLITNALYLLEGLCYGNELHHDMESELGGTPNPDEVRSLMDHIEGQPIDVRLMDLPDHLAEAIGDHRWDIWQDDPWDYDVGEEDSVIGSWIGSSRVKEIDVCLQSMGILHARFYQ